MTLDVSGRRRRAVHERHERPDEQHSAAGHVDDFEYRGPGTVTVAEPRPKLTTLKGGKPDEPYSGQASTTVKFATPGEYMLHVTANDFSGNGGGGSVCCWTTAIMKVSVSAAPTRDDNGRTISEATNMGTLGYQILEDLQAVPRRSSRKSSRDPDAYSTAGWPRRNTRASACPSSVIVSPSMCSHAPSRKPTTAGWFSSWNSAMRCSRVSPICVEPGIGS